MATGDMKNNLRKLQNELKSIHYSEKVDYQNMLVGLSEPFLPILHHVFSEYSCELSSFFSAKGYDLYAKSDFRFLEVIYRILVQEFETKPLLTKQQFFSIGYAENKVIFTTRILALCRRKSESLAAKKKKKIKGNVKVGIENTKTNIVDVPKMVQDTSEAKCNTEIVNVTEPVPETLFRQPRINPPQPTPQLALSPIKVSKREVAPEVHERKYDLESDLLDLTDIGESSFIEINEVEEIDTEEEYEVPVLPHFTITKHSSNEVNVNRKSTVEMQPNHSLPENVSVTLPSVGGDTAGSCQNCERCVTNHDVIQTLVKKMGKMEEQISSLLDVNNDLSAKVLLMETKFKVMECSAGDEKQNNVQETYNDLASSTLSECPTKFPSSQPIIEVGHNSSENGDIDFKRVSAVNTDEVTIPASTKSYSPIKYTDDDIIIKDFKPIRMEDLYMMNNEPVMEERKENIEPKSKKILKERKENYQVIVIDDESEGNTDRQSQQNVKNGVGMGTRGGPPDTSRRPCDMSVHFDDAFTEQAVQKVKARLRETEKMLSGNGSFVVD